MEANASVRHRDGIQNNLNMVEYRMKNAAIHAEVQDIIVVEDIGSIKYTRLPEVSPHFLHIISNNLAVSLSEVL